MIIAVSLYPCIDILHYLRVCWLSFRYSNGSVGVWSCSTCRLLWCSRAYPVGEGVIEMYLVPAMAGGQSCLPKEPRGGGEILVTQNRTGHLRTWCIDWEQMTMDALPNAFHCLDSLEFFTFTKMGMVKTMSHTYVVYPVGEDAVYISCCRCGHAACNQLGKRIDNHERRGMVTALSGMAIEGGIMVLVGYENGSIVAYRVADGDGPVSLLFENKSKVNNPCVSIDICLANETTGGIEIAAGYAGDAMGEDSEVKHDPLVELGHVDIQDKVEYRTKFLLLATKKQNSTLRGMDQVVFREDGKYFAAACWDGKVRIYRVSSGKLVDVIVHHKDAATFVLFFKSMHSGISIDGQKAKKCVAIGSRDGTVSIWSMSSSS